MLLLLDEWSQTPYAHCEDCNCCYYWNDDDDDDDTPALVVVDGVDVAVDVSILEEDDSHRQR